MSNRTSNSVLAHRLRPVALWVAGVFAVLSQGWQPAHAFVTDIAALPIFSATPPATDVKPNVFLVLDDSGSMGWQYMPDEANDFSGRYGFASAQCNGVFYNPKVVYKPPVDASGNSFTNQSFTGASNDGYGVFSGGTTDLSSNFSTSGFSAQAAFYYTYSGTQTTEAQKNYYNTNSIFYKECRSSIGTTTAHDGTNPVNTLFTKVVVSATSGPGGTDERTNFANWYSYYRTRMNMMKTATGLAFKSITDKFRVGFMSLNNNASPAFLNVADFDATQKASFYSKLYASSTGSSTPLRTALSRAGRLYANKISTIHGQSVTDPVQYACQQNYTILSTDGQWNDADSGAVQLDGSTQVGNQDGALPRPYNDGSQVTTTKVTPYTSTQDRTTVNTASTVTRVWERTNTTYGGDCTTTGAPNNTSAAPLAVRSDRVAALGYSTTDPDGSGVNRCYNVGNNIWFCRSGGSLPTPVVSAASATSSTDVTWYLVSNISGQTGCISADTAWPGSGYSTTAGICPTQTVTGKRVTTRAERQTETITGLTETIKEVWEATQTTTQTIINGVPGSVGPMTPSTPSYSYKNDVTGYPSSTVTTDTCGGVSAPCPSTAGSWSNEPPNPNNVCIATSSLPAAGTTSPVKISEVRSGTTQTNTTTQLTTQVAGSPTETSVGSGGVANTLADVAAYYYATNLRTSALGNCTGTSPLGPTDLCVANTVPKNDPDNATWQHMTTFTLGLGVRGRMVFSPTYLTDTTGDFAYVAKETTASSSTCTWRDTLTVAGGKCNWPVPGANNPENTDDLWHASVNGRGNYFSASDPLSLASGMSSTLKKIVNTPRAGTASAAATTNPRITSGNNFQFSSYFKTVEWSGDLIRQTMNLADGSVPNYDHLNPDPTAYDWSAATLLNARAYTSRVIYTSTGKGITSSRINFDWSSLGAAALQSYFTTPNISTTPPEFATPLTGLTQFCSTGDCISSTAQTNTTVATGGAAGEALVNFLRGDRSNEEGPVLDNSKFFRYRKSVLGDIVSAQPQYVGAPDRFYSDAGYAAYKTLWASRTPIVYTAANDGMLHAFNANTGAEAWAFIPSFMLPRMYTLADKNYRDKHQYFVEGTPVTGEICPKAPSLTCSDTEWRTIIVGGHNGGGSGYYALDVTDPANPSVLWEFTDDNMGLTFGKPQITKLDDGTWVVLLTSGYNNCPRTASQQGCVKSGVGDGMGRLYVLNAKTGVQISGSPIVTGVGSSIDPSGLAQILAHANTNNVTERVYGGDLMGNLFRFTIKAGSFGVHKLAVLKDSTATLQPITVRPQVTTVNGMPVVYVGTGRYLGPSDVGGTPKNSFYAIKDDVVLNPTYNSPRTYTSFIGHVALDTTCPAGTDVSVCKPGDVVRTVSQVSGSSGDSLKNMNGWYLDFPAGAGEIEFTDPKLSLGTLAFSTSIPKAATTETCASRSGSSDGDALAYMVDYLTGGSVGTTSGVVAVNIGSGVATAPQIAQLPNGTVIAKYRLSTGQEVSVPLRFGSSGGSTRRISWRELISE